jgi:hypothetical protein
MKGFVFENSGNVLKRLRDALLVEFAIAPAQFRTARTGCSGFQGQGHSFM